ncbi:MAG: glutathione synthase [Deltaproteobacteria bacterium]|nr:glutathione synthase [Deltaproteobacteria bacterium]
MNRKKPKFGVVADPIGTFDPEAETTFFLLKEITLRGHEGWIMEMKDLFLCDGEVFGRARKVTVRQKGKIFVYESDDKKEIALKNLNCIFLRKDPPVDIEYVNHLTLLEMVENSPPLCKARSGGVESGLVSTSPTPSLQRRGGFIGPLIINSPSGIKKANEKIYPFYFSGVSPPSVVSQSGDVLLTFLKKIKKGVIKPLNAGGGKGILLVNHGDPDAKSLLEVATHGFTRYVLLQKYVPEARKGDKRVLLLNGEPLGSFLRVPSRDDFRGNMHSGARWVKAVLTAHEKKIISRLKPRLLADGLLFVGIDFIGPYVTEINTTSPMGIREINQLDNSQIEKSVINLAESGIFSAMR